MASDNLAEASVVGQLTIEVQRDIVAQLAEVREASPLVRPKTPSGLAMRVQVTAAGSVGWVGDGAYRYSELDARGNPWPPIPDLWRVLADEAVRSFGPGHPWDCAIINWYAWTGFGKTKTESASLGWHRDLAEQDHSLPIVTFSIGDACSWAMKLDDDEPVHRVRLESGAVTLLEGRTRMALHTVERIIPAPMFSPLPGPGRVSITMRVAR